MQSVSTLALWALAATPALAGESEARFEISGRAFQRAEAQANTFIASSQEAVTLARDAAGRTLVVWQSRKQEDGNYGLYAQRFAADGTKLGAETHVNQYTKFAQTRPAVALDASGAAWIAWESDGQDGSFGTIVARRFDAELDTATNEVIVNDALIGHQTDVALACDAAGNAVIAWAGPNEHKTRSIFVRRFGPDGQPLGASVCVGAQQATVDSLPSVAIDPLGGFVIAWGRADAAGKPLSIVARAFDAAGAPRGDAFVVSAADGRMPIEAVADVNARGELVVGWLNSFGDGDHVPTVRRFTRDETGFVAGAIREYPSGKGGYTSGLDLSLADDSSFALVWAAVQGEDKKGDLWARVIGADDVAGEAFRASLATEGRQKIRAGGSSRRIVYENDGSITTAWQGDAGFGDDFAACVSFFAPAEPAEGSTRVALAELPASPRFVADEQGAAPSHEPPIYDPDGAKTIADLMDFKSTAGPDFGFTGIVQTSLTPPDPHGAIGPNHYVQVVNDSIAFYTKGGTQTFLQTYKGPGGFMAPLATASDFPFDAEVIFDPYSQRFIFMTNVRVGANAKFDLAVSDDADPNGTWFKYRFDVTAAAGNDGGIDSPNIGVDQNVIYLSADFFTGGTKFLLFNVEKAPCLTGGTPITKSLLINGTQSYGAPVMYDSTAPAFYYLENLELASNNAIKIHAIRNPLTTPTDTIFTLTVPTYTPPEDPPQLGTSIRPEAFESRFWSCTYRAGKLWGAAHCNNPVRARWYEIDVGNWPVSGTPTLVQSGDIIPAANVRTSFVSIGVDAQNNAACVYARSSPSEFFSMARSFRLNGDAAGTMTPAVTMKTSTGADTSGRWGDYSACTPDPVVPKVWWGTHEYRAGIWSTWIGMFGPCEVPTTYCTAKVNSAGLTPQIGSQNEPSFATNTFDLTMTNGLAGKSVIAFWGTGQQAAPFFGGTLCVTLPIVRSSVANFDGTGSIAINRPIDIDEVGIEQYAQFWYRDPAHPDGTGVGLSNALAFRPCP
ncbi:MAG: hypothetical protein L6Q99_18560 [Planctomycetes bacterium]|nr:hypothetical protein [Planctomycetota bacterium]